MWFLNLGACKNSPRLTDLSLARYQIYPLACGFTLGIHLQLWGSTHPLRPICSLLRVQVLQKEDLFNACLSLEICPGCGLQEDEKMPSRNSMAYAVSHGHRMAGDLNLQLGWKEDIGRCLETDIVSRCFEIVWMKCFLCGKNLVLGIVVFFCVHTAILPLSRVLACYPAVSSSISFPGRVHCI